MNIKICISFLILLIVSAIVSSAKSDNGSNNVIKSPNFSLVKYSLMKKYTEATNHARLDKHLKNLAVERHSGSEEIKKVAKYIVSQFDTEQHWDVEFDTFTDKTPFGQKEFNNIIVTSKYPLDDPLAPTLILAAHYDSKYFKEFKFLATVDSAVSIAMIIEIAKSMEHVLMNGSPKRLKLIFFDGEEAFIDWTETDSLYGSRHLAKKFANQTLVNENTGESKPFYDTIELFMLLDLIGGPDPTFSSAHPPTAPLFKKMMDIESKLSSKRMISYRPNKYFTGQFLPGEIQDDRISERKMLRNSNNIKDDFQQPFTPFQIEFLAEDESITIVPNFRMEELHFLSGTYGPFVPALPVNVPLWLAITLKKKKKCKIQFPQWLSLERLTDKYEAENNVETSFESMPPYYIEIATLLLSVASDDTPNANGIRGLIEDIINRRQNKLSDTIIEALKPVQSVDPLRINNITMMEINRIRPTICSGLNHLQKISQIEQSVSSTSQSSQQQPSSSSQSSQLYNTTSTTTTTTTTTSTNNLRNSNNNTSYS
ncbi:peptidase M28E domain containing-protein [Heterostelium album PN500]|uniref:Peptidase M28E domain containing-protein n=1 Tax=Heterostelium pallidum (strain ATCC 26659 / Pp 5 / PN500) TaxID=670386 RepID=D3BPG5_HETP5|nr:peptidase M28E domain containing-protein [Heterostelium album PN500]EFA76683.1 peptidase M28E domain containing-protein [Heterostelium album PN500]|eukprot:XP_020428815.1 peptidase M28E domain containing-protein [Heterostelium album PN500]